MAAHHHRHHRHADAFVVAMAKQRQRPGVRRCPQEDDEKQNTRFEAERAGHRHPADHGRECPRCAADDDVLRRRAFQPHGVEEHVIQNREQQQARGLVIDEQVHDHHRQRRQHHAEHQRAGGFYLACRDGAMLRAFHKLIDVAVVPHVDGARRPRADGDA